MQGFELRPHHILCIGFFRGMGYSPEFTANMERITEMLRSGETQIRLTLSGDVLCGSCPHSSGNSCGTKAGRYDRTVLSLCGLDEGDILQWRQLREIAERNIIGCGRLSEVCGDCQWFGICGSSQ
ncbi:MAG: DUF1284 domain-containing protein [Ruminococcus sp.]|nr:DUF1284 domain-containing protein [Ruminococcus sp.]